MCPDRVANLGRFQRVPADAVSVKAEDHARAPTAINLDALDNISAGRSIEIVATNPDVGHHFFLLALAFLCFSLYVVV